MDGGVGPTSGTSGTVAGFLSAVGTAVAAFVAGVGSSLVSAVVSPELAMRSLLAFAAAGFALLALLKVVSSGGRWSIWRSSLVAGLVVAVAVAVWIAWPYGNRVADYIRGPAVAEPVQLEPWQAELRASILAHPGDPAPGLALASSVAFSADGALLATGGYDSVVRLWNSDTGEPVATLVGHTHQISAVEFLPGSSTMLASASLDGTVRIWEVPAGRQTAVIETAHGFVYSMAISPDGAYLATAGEEPFVRVFDLGSRVQVRELSAPDAWVQSLAFSPAAGGTVLAAGLAQNISSGPMTHIVRLWDLDTGQQLTELAGHRNWVTGLAFNEDGSILLTAGHDRTLRRWDVVGGAPLGGPVTDIVTGGDSIASVAAAGIIAVSEGSAVSLRDFTTGRRLATTVNMPTPIVDVALGPDGKRLAAATVSGTVGLWALG